MLVSISDPYINNGFFHAYAVCLTIYWMFYGFVSTSTSPIGFFVQHVAGWIISDIISYGIHMFIDGDLYCRLFVINRIETIVDSHHKYPKNYSRLTHAQLVALSYPILFPLAMIMRIVIPGVVWCPFKSSIMFWGMISGHCHMWSHKARGDLPRAVLWLQDHGVILSRELHARHHRPPFASHFSLINGFTDRVFEIMRVQWSNSNE